MHTSTASDGTLVVLQPGVSVTQEAIQLLWAFEDRGLTLRLDGKGLLVGPRSQLTPADRSAIHRHKDELMSLLHVCTEEAM